MKEVTVIRVPSDEHQTLGILKVKDSDFMAKTLELAWKNNENNISCIPADTYICKYTRSKRISEKHLKEWLKKNPTKTEVDCPDEEKNVYTYEITGVPNRAGIRIHSANFFHDLLGCVSLGDKDKALDLDKDGSMDVLHSGATIKAFEKVMNYEDFNLIIK